MITSNKLHSAIRIARMAAGRQRVFTSDWKYYHVCNERESNEMPRLGYREVNTGKRKNRSAVVGDIAGVIQ